MNLFEMNQFAAKRKYEEYAQVYSSMKEAEIQKSLLQNRLSEIVASEVFEGFVQIKKSKMNPIPNQKGKVIQTSLISYLKPKEDPNVNFVSHLIHDILKKVWKVINPNDTDHSSNMSKPLIQMPAIVKCIYSNKLKRKVRDLLQNNSLVQTYIICGRRIPKSTLFGWNKEQLSKPGKQGEKHHLSS